MPTVIPISEMQRNVASVAEECHQTGQPIYLTKNGKASLVVMDASEFDRKYSSVDNIRAHEERVQRAIARGYDDLLSGRTRPWDDAKKAADAIREAQNAG